MLELELITLYNIVLDCGQPVLSPNVSVVSTTGSTEGDTVTLQCEDGLSLIISCNRSGMWSPSPAELVCNSPQGEFNYLRIIFKCVLELLLATLFFVSARNYMHINIFIVTVGLLSKL